MITCIVLLHTEPAAIGDVAEALTEIDGVSEVYSVTGDWELVAMIRVREHDEIADVVTGRIAKTPGVTGTHTMIAFRTSAPSDLGRMWGVGMEGEEGL